MKRALLTIALLVLPALVSAKPVPYKQAIVTYDAGNPTSFACSGYQNLWWNTATNVLWFCENGTWVSTLSAAGTGTGFPITGEGKIGNAGRIGFTSEAAGTGALNTWLMYDPLIGDGDAIGVFQGPFTHGAFGASTFTANVSTSGNPNFIYYFLNSPLLKTGMYMGSNQGVAFGVNGVKMFECWEQGTSPGSGYCTMTTPTGEVAASFSLPGIAYGNQKVLTESTTQAFARTNTTLAFGGWIDYCVSAFDATTGRQTRCSSFRWALSVAGAGGAETCALVPAAPVTELNDDNAAALSAGTLTYTITTDTTATTDGCDFTINSTSSLTQTALVLYWQVRGVAPYTTTPQ